MLEIGEFQGAFEQFLEILTELGRLWEGFSEFWEISRAIGNHIWLYSNLTSMCRGYSLKRKGSCCSQNAEKLDGKEDLKVAVHRGQKY